jgi:hypothetical protein
MIFTSKTPVVEEVRDKIEGITSEKVFMFLEYWKSKRIGATDVPLKDDLDPIDLGSMGVLPYIWLAEVPLAGRPKYRLGGERISDVFHRSLRGVSVDEVFVKDTADRVAARWQRIVSERLASVGLGTVYPDRSTSYRGEGLILPARSHEGRCDLVIGITEYHQSFERTPDGQPVAHFDTQVVYFVPISRI